MGGWEQEVVLRPGLVYSDPPRSVFAMFDKLSAHFDGLLPVLAVSGEARHLAHRDCADLAEADLAVMRRAPAPAECERDKAC